MTFFTAFNARQGFFRKTSRTAAVLAAFCALGAASCKEDVGEYEFAVMPKTLSLSAGVTYKLATEWPPDDTAVISWSSDSASVTVDAEGNVTGVGLGEAVITAKALNAGGAELASARCEVTVADETSITTDFSVNPSFCYLVTGGTMQLSTDGAPEETTVEWSSSQTDVATVSDAGLVTAAGAGQTVVTAVLKDTSSVPLASATCAVTVTTDSVGAFAVVPATLSVDVGETAYISTANSPDGTTDISWSSNSVAASVAGSGEITALFAGNAIITATANSGSVPLASATCAVTITTPPGPNDADTLAVLVQSGTATEIYLKTPTYTLADVISQAVSLANAGTSSAPGMIKLIAGRTYTVSAAIETGGKNLQISTYSAGTATINRGDYTKNYAIIRHASGTLVLGDGVAANKIVLDGEWPGDSEYPSAIYKPNLEQTGGTVTLKDGVEITRGSRSGVYVSAGTFSMEGGVIKKCVTPWNSSGDNTYDGGGGVHVSNALSFKKTGGDIYGGDGGGNRNLGANKGNAVYIKHLNKVRDANAGPLVELDSSGIYNWQ